MDWQVVAALEDGELIAECPDATPNPAVELRQTLPDGTEFKAVWSQLRESGVAKLPEINHVHFRTTTEGNSADHISQVYDARSRTFWS